MAVYLFKTTLLSFLFWGFYQLILRQEKILMFNRFFLLFSATVSFIIPFWISQTTYLSISNSPLPTTETEGWMYIASLQEDPKIHIEDLLWGIYAIGFVCMLVRFGKKLYPIVNLIREGNQTPKKGYTQVFHPKTQEAFSFLHFIFLPGSGDIALLLKHELAHVKQKHSLDILWIEFLHCLAWLNPVIILFKRAMRLNHEFLADQAVTRDLLSPEPYVHLILEKASILKNPLLVSPMHIGQTKARFEMIFTSNKKVMNTLKQVLSFLLILASFQLFGKEQILLTDKIPQHNLSPEPSISYVEESEEVFKDLNMEDGGMMLYVEVEGRKGRYILGWIQGGVKVKFLNKAGKWVTKICKDLSQQEREHFWNLDASKAQAFRPLPPVKEPTPEQLKDFQDPEKYGLWLNGKRTPNHELANFSPDKIHRFFYSGLEKNAAHYGQYTYHLSVETKAYINRKYSGDKGGNWEDIYLKEKEHYKKLFKQ
ncbi:MAG: M56 family metallopeptidase [Bacteroidota bacterium]